MTVLPIYAFVPSLSHQNEIFMKTQTTNPRQLSHSVVSHVMNVPIEKVDIADWLLNLPDAEYQRCSTAHIAAGSSVTDDGRPMSINVETIGNATIIQHYVAEIHEPHYCRMVSISDAISVNGRTKVKVQWELRATKIDDTHTEYTNEINAFATDEFLEFIEEHKITLEEAANARQNASDSHNKEETPNFAKSIERKALLK
ncbi:hypothetical protein SAMN05421788_109228 [Filimonas lacunae]|uniref:Polyketide cyclase / dehydrase and lipid transport n=2 Tax=Filimonas lacunae TaxID=477680 RepID=A0A1N7R602_9BACT|nr:hypothetical protein SAMN05421788_109228 [Filimonas lacunae]